MNEKYELIRKKNKYLTMKECLKSVASSLDDAADSLEDANRNLSYSYAVDGESYDNNNLRKKQDSILSYKNKIYDRIIPSINYELERLEREINKLA